ncbi:MAG: oleate hydratase [Streptococcus sp.]
MNEIARITTQEPGNALIPYFYRTSDTTRSKDVTMSIVVHHQPHFTSQKPNETVLWGYSLPRRHGKSLINLIRNDW